MTSPDWKWHFLTVKRLREILDHLEPTDWLAATDIGTLAIVRDGKYVGFLDTYGGGNGIVSADEQALPSVEYDGIDGWEPGIFEMLDKAMGKGGGA